MEKRITGVASKLRYPLIAVLVLFGFVTIIGTGGGGGSSGGGGGGGGGTQAERFLATHTNEDGDIGAGAYISTFSVAKDECTFEVVDDVYPPNNNTDSHVYGHGDIVALGLHSRFIPPNTRNDQEMRSAKGVGAWFTVGDSSVQDLPLSPLPGEGRYTAINGASIQVSPSGHIFYVTTNKSDYYFTDDQYYFVARFNPATGITEHTDPDKRDAFVAAQPETNDYYGNLWAAISGTIYASDNGRYVYGTITPRSYYSGMWYGAGPRYLFEYDFETEAFRRLGDAQDGKDHTLGGITKDGRYLFYRHDGVTKRLNIETEQITILENAPFHSTLRTSWNNEGFVSIAYYSYGDRLSYYNAITDEAPVNTARQPGIAGAYNYTYKIKPQVSSDGSKLYFVLNAGAWYYGPDSDERLDAEENMLYVMSDFTSDTPQTKAVCQMPSNVQGIKIIWD